MPLTELPQSVLFTIFLLLFVLVGIYPAWKKTARLLRTALRKAEHKIERDEVQSPAEPPDLQAEYPLESQLSDFEVFILRRMAQESNKPLSRRQINADLHFEPTVLKPALKSLLRKGLLRVKVGYLTGVRYHLSANGRNYAIDCGYLPRIHQQAG